MIFPVKVFATSWLPVYPYSQKTENGKVECKSYPYEVDKGPHGLGETFVYSGGRLLYTIDKYFYHPFFTANNGEYIIEYQTGSDFHIPDILLYPNGKEMREPFVFDMDAVKIYKSGALSRLIHFSSLGIDTTKLDVNYNGHWVNWGYQNKIMNDSLGSKMAKNPVFMEGGNIYLITCDDQLIGIQLSSGKIVSREKASSTLGKKRRWNPVSTPKEFFSVKYPEDGFYELKTIQGMELDSAILNLFGLTSTDVDRDKAKMRIDIRQLLINRDSVCEKTELVVEFRDEGTKKFNYNPGLSAELEKWVLLQRFDTLLIPEGFQKFCFSGIVYLR